MRKQLSNAWDENWMWGDGEYSIQGLSTFAPAEDLAPGGGLDLRLEGLRVGEDWKRCGSRVNEILRSLESRDDPEARRHECSRLREALRSLKDDIRRHFRSVESGPLYREFLDEFPEYSDQLERLRYQRRQILRRVDQVLHVLRAGVEVPQSVKSQVRSILDDVQSVSQAESDFLWEAHYVDIPALD